MAISKLNVWYEGKPTGLSIIAQQIAVSAEACFEFLKLLKVGGRIEKKTRGSHLKY